MSSHRLERIRERAEAAPKYSSPGQALEDLAEAEAIHFSEESAVFLYHAQHDVPDLVEIAEAADSLSHVLDEVVGHPRPDTRTGIARIRLKKALQQFWEGGAGE